MQISMNFNSIEELEQFISWFNTQGAVELTAKTGYTVPDPDVPATEESTPEPEPESAPVPDEPGYSKEDVRKILSDKQKEGKKDKVTELIESFGVDRFTKIPPEKYPELVRKAREL